MKKINFILLFSISLFSFNINAQKISLDDLLNLQKLSLEQINNILLNKGWKFEGSSNSSNNDERVGWSFNKSLENEKALAWFYLQKYGRDGNYITYQTNKNNFILLQNKCKTNGFKSDAAIVKEDKLYIGYFKNEIKVYFTTAKNDNIDDDDRTDVFYSIEIYNEKKLNETLAEIEKLKADELAEIEKKQKEDLAAEKLKQEALEKENKLKNEFDNFIKLADTYLETNKLELAKTEYNKALLIYPNEFYPKNQIEKIEEINTFLITKNYDIFQYKKINPSYFNEIIENIKGEVAKIPLSLESGKFNNKVVLKFDLEGNKSVSFLQLNKRNYPPTIIKSIEELNIISPKKYNYFISTIDTISYDLDFNESIISVKKNDSNVDINETLNNIGREEVNSFLQGKSSGKYKLSLKKVTLNSKEYYIINQIKFKGKKIKSNNKYYYSGGSALIGGLGLAYYYLKDLFK